MDACKNNVALTHPYHEGKWCSKFDWIPPSGLGGDSLMDRWMDNRHMDGRMHGKKFCSGTPLPWTEVMYITSVHGMVCKNNIIFTGSHPSMHLSSVHLSIMLSPPKALGGIQPNLQHHFPLWWVCARATLFYCASVHLLSVYLTSFVEFCLVVYEEIA